VNSRSMRFHPAMDTQWSLGNSENLCPHSGWGARGVERCQLWPNSGETHCVRTARQDRGVQSVVAAGCS